MKKVLLSLAAVLGMACANEAFAQSRGYDSGIGLRLGGDVGITYVHGMGDNSLDLIGGWRLGDYNGSSYLGLSGLYRWHFPVGSVTNLDWYVGPGVGLGFWDGPDNNGNNNNDNDGFSLSILGQLGIQYTLEGAPINFALDWIPGFQLIPGTDFFGGNVGLSVRYVW